MEIILNCEDKAIMEKYLEILTTSGHKVHCILDEESKDSNENLTLRAIEKSKELFCKYNIVTISIIKGIVEDKKRDNSIRQIIKANKDNVKYAGYLDNHKKEMCELISASIYNGFENIAFEFKTDGYAQYLEPNIKKALNLKPPMTPNLSRAYRWYQVSFNVAHRAWVNRCLIEARDKSYSSGLEYRAKLNTIINMERIDARIEALSRRYEKKQN